MNSHDRRIARRLDDRVEEATWRQQAELELRTDGTLSVDTYAALNSLGIDPDTIEEN